MSSDKKSREKAGKSEKSPSRLNPFLVPGSGSKPQIPTLVPPVLKQVGKLAVGVASVSTSNASSGSATGNPRNKVALQPGHSLMDWIRLGTSGKDLTGMGARAGTLSVTKQELAKHNTKQDAWLAIRGRVYCVTEYFPFHPGGEDELIRGAGIDATSLFDEVHPWVNYEQILSKCLVGKLVAIDPSVNREALFFGEEVGLSTTSSPTNVEASPSNSEETLSKESQLGPTVQETEPPRFDWIQKSSSISIIFYTRPFSNPLVRVSKPEDDQSVTIVLSYNGSTFVNEVKFHDKVSWPCDVHLVIETGKVELGFRKCTSAIWDSFGNLQQQAVLLSGSGSTGSRSLKPTKKTTYVINKKAQVNYNTWMFKLNRKDNQKIVVPVGNHIKIFGMIDDKEMFRAYTPVPESVFDNFIPNRPADYCSIVLVIKRYPDGKISKFITDKNEQDEVEVGDPSGSFDTKLLEKRETFLMLSAGTGLTPMLSIAMFLLERRVKKCQFIRLLFFNRSEKDVLLRGQLEQLAEADKRFKIDNILSEPSDDWNGLKGHVSAVLIENSLKEHLQDTGYTIKSIFCFLCGPSKFNKLAKQELAKIGVEKEQIVAFG